MSPLHILEVKTLLVAPFANIFSQFIGCLFILFMVAVQKLAIQKPVSLIRSRLLIFALISIVLWN